MERGANERRERWEEAAEKRLLPLPLPSIPHPFNVWGLQSAGGRSWAFMRVLSYLCLWGWGLPEIYLSLGLGLFLSYISVGPFSICSGSFSGLSFLFVWGISVSGTRSLSEVFQILLHEFGVSAFCISELHECLSLSLSLHPTLSPQVWSLSLELSVSESAISLL